MPARPFGKAYGVLPASVRAAADKSFALLKRDPPHSSLHLKKVGDYRSARVTKRYRALATETEDGLLWLGSALTRITSG